MKIKQILLITGILAITLLGFYIIKNKSKSDWVVVDVIRLFNNYKMTIDMEQADSLQLLKEFKEIDSIQQILKIQYNSVSKEEQAYLAQYYNSLDEKRDAALIKSNERINEAVWKQLNKLIPEYAKEKNIKVMAGANGMGNVMYYDATYDITDELIQYVNMAYNEER